MLQIYSVLRKTKYPYAGLCGVHFLIMEVNIVDILFYMLSPFHV